MSRLPASTTPQRGVARPVSHPHDAAEREADRVADVVAGGGHVRGWSLSVSPPAHATTTHIVQRDNGDKEKKAQDRTTKNYKEAAKKTAEALAKTETGKAVKQRILESPEVKALKDAATSPAGLAIGGAAIVGGVAGLALTGRELPFQPPAIPLDRVGLEGWKATPRVTGPLNRPSFVGVTLTIPLGRPRRHPRRGTTETRPAPAPDPMTDAEFDEIMRQIIARSPLGVPVMDLGTEVGFGAAGSSGAFQLREPFEPGAGPRRGRGPYGDIRLVDDLELGAPERREDDEPVRRWATSDRDVGRAGHVHVDDAISGSGRPLGSATRGVMEGRFGHDFSSVRLHDDRRAAAAADSVDARAFTVGEDIVVGNGQDVEATPRLLAHELAHVVQQRGVRRPDALPVHREPRGEDVRVQARAGDHQMFVDAAIQYLRNTAEHWRSVRRLADGPQRGAAQREGPRSTDPPAEGATGSTMTGPSGRAGGPQAAPSHGLDPERSRTVLQGLLDTYEASRRTIERHLGADPGRQQQLQGAYVAAVEAVRAATASSGRGNLVIVAAPEEVGDTFIANATTYASLYYATGQPGDTVEVVTDIATPAELFDAIEAAAPERMLRRIDVFAHGTIEPTHQIRFGTTWYTLAQIEAAAAARARTGATLRSQTRFDASTVIELHACRLGAEESLPDEPDTEATRGEDFLGGLGRAAGGARGQQVIGYEQRWVPRRFTIPGVTSTADVGTTGRQAEAFDDMAVDIWDAAMAGGVEGQAQLTPAERRSTAELSRQRKIEIMRRLFDAAGGAWIIGHQYSGDVPQSVDPRRDVLRGRDTFTSEADWEHRILRVTVPRSTEGTP